MTTARARLTRDRVLAAAVALADREGAEALTVRRLAEDLGVHPTSLYNHVASKTAILDGVVERLFTEIPAVPSDSTWEQWVREVADSLRALARNHPGAFMVLTRRPAENDAAYDITEAGLAAFRGAGFSPLQAVQAVRAASLSILGLALNECPPMGDWVDPGLTDAALEGRPRLREAAELRIEAGEGHWELLVEALIAGLRALR
jgi:AcrR family transcriptional regulator